MVLLDCFGLRYKILIADFALKKAGTRE